MLPTPPLYLMKHIGNTLLDRAPDIEQTKSYDLELVNAIKSSDLDKIKTLHKAGRR